MDAFEFQAALRSIRGRLMTSIDGLWKAIAKETEIPLGAIHEIGQRSGRYIASSQDQALDVAAGYVDSRGIPVSAEQLRLLKEEEVGTRSNGRRRTSSLGSALTGTILDRLARQGFDVSKALPTLRLVGDEEQKVNWALRAAQNFLNRTAVNEPYRVGNKGVYLWSAAAAAAAAGVALAAQQARARRRRPRWRLVANPGACDICRDVEALGYLEVWEPLPDWYPGPGKGPGGRYAELRQFEPRHPHIPPLHVYCACSLQPAPGREFEFPAGYPPEPRYLELPRKKQIDIPKLEIVSPTYNEQITEQLEAMLDEYLSRNPAPGS